ncbi:MAG: 50S ribosomal protein L4 [Candidatus Dormibacteria bacterium]
MAEETEKSAPRGKEIEVRGRDGKVAGKLRLDGHLFDTEVNGAVLHQAFVRQMANQRQGTSSTKTRTEVQGGGRKPYRQKGTGRARQGSIRAPHYAGGGIVFGPKPRKYTQDMPRKQRRLALRSALSVKNQENRLVVVENLEFEVPRTREFVNLLADSGVQGSVLVVLENHNINAEKSARNLVGVKVILSRNLNVRDLLNHDWLLMTRAAVDQVGEVLV